MKLNKKGFTLYELLITYSLAFIVIITIFSSIADLSSKLSKLYIKDNITANQLLVYRSIGNDFSFNGINNISQCSDGLGGNIQNCVTITYNSGTPNSKNLEIGEDYISYDGIKTKFKYGKIDLNQISLNAINTNINISGVNTNFQKIVKLYIPIIYESKHYDITLLCTNSIDYGILNGEKI